VLGALIGVALRPAPTPLPREAWIAVPAAAAALLSVLAFGLATSAPTGTTARVSLTEAPGAGGRQALADVRIDPPEAAGELRWLTATAWQGGGRVVDRLERTGPGTYRSTRPLPLHGEWKALIRLHSGRGLLGVPVYLPADPAIPAAAVPAPASFTRPFVRDKEILQREAKPGAPALTALAYGVVAAIALSLLVLLGWALARLASEAGGRPGVSRRAEPGSRQDADDGVRADAVGQRGNRASRRSEGEAGLDLFRGSDQDARGLCPGRGQRGELDQDLKRPGRRALFP